jgi:hypothetical protein
VPVELGGVGGQRQILDAGQGGDASRQLGDVAPQQRLAAGQADALDAEPGERADQSLDLVEVEPVLGLFETLEAFRNAVAAAQVAAVGDR